MGGSSSKQNSSFIARQFPGVFGTKDYDISSNIGGQALSSAEQAAGNWDASPYIDQFNELVSGNMGSITGDATNQAILNSLMDLTSGRNAARGLGAPTQSALMQSIAPELGQMRQDSMANLMGAETQQFMQNLGSAQALQSLAESAMPQIVAGNSSFGRSGGMQICCFIFMEAYDGQLLNVVRKYRDEHVTVRSRRGYYRMADVIIPLMRKSVIFKKVVKFFMTDPMVSYGEWYYGENRWGVVYAPITKFWLKVFDMLGGDKPYTRKNGEVI
jgi:hypothetical protein